MRWTEQPAPLPVQPLAALAERAPGLLATLRGIDPRAGLVVDVAPEVLETVTGHLERHREERGGLLLGEVYAEDADVARSRLVRVLQAVPAPNCDGTVVSLRMASEVWEAARARLGPGAQVIGWYHSHPGLGAFFSHTDRQTQRAFFAHAYSVGWVIDPLRGEAAWFVGADSGPPARVLYGVAGGFDGAGTGAGTAAGASGATP